MQLILNAHTIENQTQRRGDQTEHHSRQSHLRFSDPTISLSEEIRSTVAEIPSAEDSNEGPNYSGDEAEASLVWLHVIGCGVGGGDVGGYGDDEANCYGLDEGAPEDWR